MANSASLTKNDERKETKIQNYPFSISTLQDMVANDNLGICPFGVHYKYAQRREHNSLDTRPPYPFVDKLVVLHNQASNLCD